MSQDKLEEEQQSEFLWNALLQLKQKECKKENIFACELLTS